MVGNDSAKR